MAIPVLVVSVGADSRRFGASTLFPICDRKRCDRSRSGVDRACLPAESACSSGRETAVFSRPFRPSPRYCQSASLSPRFWLMSYRIFGPKARRRAQRSRRALRRRTRPGSVPCLRRFSPALERVAGDRIEKFLSDPFGTVDEVASTEVTTPEGTQVTTRGGSVILATLDLLARLLLVPFFVFYILIDFPAGVIHSKSCIPPRFREPFSRMFDESGNILETYVRGQLVIALIMSVCLRDRILVSRRSCVGGHRADRRPAQRDPLHRHCDRYLCLQPRSRLRTAGAYGIWQAFSGICRGANSRGLYTDSEDTSAAD